MANYVGRLNTLPPRFCKQLLFSLILIVVFKTVFVAEARAQFEVCNRSIDVINVAIGFETEGTFSTRGWWTIGPNSCADVIRDELRSRYIYVYAMDVFGQSLLYGTTRMCLGDKRFRIAGISDCWENGHIAADFYEVDTKDNIRWTLFVEAAQ